MTDTILFAFIGLLGGFFGAMVGLGGGVFIIPGLTLFMGVPIHSAVAAGLISVVATSTTAAASYVREGLSNIRLGITLETMTVLGALAGGLVGTSLGKEALSGIFGGIMIMVAVYMLFSGRATSAIGTECSDLGEFGASYYDRNQQKEVSYRPKRLWVGLLTSLIAGIVSGLLGVGGGFLNVPVLILVLGVPVRAATTTSSFMLGATACAGSLVYLTKGLIDPTVAVPVVLGVIVGAYLGSKLAVKVRSTVLIAILAVVLFALSVQMILAAAGVSIR